MKDVSTSGEWRVFIFAVALLSIAVVTTLLSACGRDNSSQAMETRLAAAPTPGLTINDHDLWERGVSKDLVWASVSLTNAAGDRVSGRTLNDFEVTETLLDGSGQVVTAETTIDFSIQADTWYQFDGPGFWERSVSAQKLDIIFIVDGTGTMSEEIGAIRDEMHDFVDRLQLNHVDFRMAAIRDDQVPGSQDIMPTNDIAPFPFSGVMEADDIHGWIDYWIKTGGENWEPTTGYDSLMLAATGFDWRTEADVRKLIVVITDTLPQSAYGNWWHLDSTAANRAAAELALEGTGIEVLYSQPATRAAVMDHPDMDRYTDSDFNPRAGCEQLSSADWDCGFATLGTRISWPFQQENIDLQTGQALTDSRYYFAWQSSISGSGTAADHSVRITIRTDDPDNPGTPLETSFEYTPVLDTTEVTVNLTNVHDQVIDDVTIDIYYEMGDRRVKLTESSPNTPTPGEVRFTLIPVGEHKLWTSYGYGDYGYNTLSYEGSQAITTPSGGSSHSFQLASGFIGSELAKARGLVQDLKYWGVTDKHFAAFAADSEAWLDTLEQGGIDWTDMERIKRFYIAMSGYVNAAGYGEVEARRLTQDFKQVLLKFRDIIQRVRGMSEDSKVVLGISLAEAIARLDLVAAGEVAAAEGVVEALKTYAEEELVPLLIDEMIELIPAGDHRALLATLVDSLILGHWDDWPELLESITGLALDQAMDEVKDQVLSQLSDPLFDALDVPDDVKPIVPYVQQILLAYGNGGYAGISQAIQSIVSDIGQYAASPQQAARWVDDIFFALHDELAAGPLRDFALPMMQLIVRSAIEQQDIDDDVVIGVLAHFFTHQIIVKPYFGVPMASRLDEALAYAKAYTPTVVSDWDSERRIVMGNDFSDFRIRGNPDDMDALNQDAWDALSQQDLIDDMANVLGTLEDVVTTVLYPLFYGLCGQGYPSCAMTDDLKNFSAALDAVGLMTKIIELSLKTEDLIELKDDVAFINDVVLVEH